MNVTPSPQGSCDLFKRLIFEVWAAGDVELGEWVWEYILHLVARPGELPGTAIAIRGEGGEGKSVVFVLLRRILGDMLLSVSDHEQVLGNFNESVVGKLAIVLEEATFVGHPHIFSRLKDRVTNETIHVNPKGRPAFSADNFARTFIVSNNEHFLLLDDFQRRNTVLEASDAWKGNAKMFADLMEQWHDGGAERFLWEAQNHQFRTIPGTQTLAISQIIETRHAKLQQELSRGPVRDAVADAVESIKSGWVASSCLQKCARALPTDPRATSAIAQEMKRRGWVSVRHQHL
jgi:hypothetical protein